MLRRLTILALCLLGITAAISLIYTLTASGPADSGPALTVDPSELPQPLPDRPDDNTDRTGGLGESSDGSLYVYDEKTGDLKQEYFWAQIDPSPGGIFDVVKPQARFHLSPRRVIQMQAETGQFVAPANRPQRGRLRGNLVITVYEAPAGEALDMSPDSPHQAIRVMLKDEASFDATLGKIESQGPLRLVAPGSEPHQVEFVGEGLILVYNEPAKRVDYLEIRKGEYLKYLAARPTAAATTAPVTSRDANAASPADAAPTAQAEVQYYHVTFEDNVKVVSSERTVSADDMSVTFGFARNQERPTAPTTTNASATGDAADSQSDGMLGAFGGEDVTLTWTGPMVMKPLMGKPVELHHARDVLVKFAGTPIISTSTNGETLTCATITYLNSLQEVRATGTLTHPLVIEAKTLGTAKAEQLAARLKERTAALFGAGSLVGAAEAKPDDRALPAGFTIKWTDRMELALADGSEPQLRRAAFYGDVDLDDPRVKLNADQLDVNFQPMPGRNQPQLERVHAVGDVAVVSDDGRINAGDLLITTVATADGKRVPAMMKGKGGVHIRDKTQDFRAAAMEITLGADAAAGGRDDMLSRRVEKITAWEDITLKLADQTHVTADHLEADAIKRDARLLGSPVKIARGESLLEVVELDLAEDGKKAKAAGAGRFIYTEADKPDKPGRKVNVTWSRAMQFADAANRIQVSGDVVAQATDSPTQENRLSADTLTLELADAPALEGEPAADQVGRRILKQVTAENKVVLLARQWTDPARTQLAMRFRATGTILDFNNVTERARILGQGTLLAEDYRPDKGQRPVATVNITGRGATLFTWSRELELSGANTAMTILGNVQMSHWPAVKTGAVNLSRPATVDLQTNKLVADMAGIGGMQAMRMSDSGSLTLDAFNAEGRVQVRHREDGSDRMITAEYLRYDAQRQTVDLTAQAGGVVEIIDTKQPKPVRATSVHWNLERDRLELRQTNY
jgi:lipopolysaccharide export system protein LptA